MKKFINVLNEEKVKYLSDLGFRYMTDIISINGVDKEIAVFIENDELVKVLNDRKRFSKKDYYYSNMMRF